MGRVRNCGRYSGSPTILQKVGDLHFVMILERLTVDQVDRSHILHLVRRRQRSKAYYQFVVPYRAPNFAAKTANVRKARFHPHGV